MSIIEQDDINKTEELVAALNAHLMNLLAKYPEINITIWGDFSSSSRYANVLIKIEKADALMFGGPS